MTDNHPELTHRELQVALGVARGRTCLEMGRTLLLSHESIRSLMKRLREKTGYRRKSQLAIWADRNKDWLESQLLVTLRRKYTRKRKAVPS